MNANSPITTHVLDIAQGCPAAGIAVRLEFCTADDWQLCGQGITKDDGRVTDLLPASAFAAARYRLTFATGEYFASRGMPTFYPQVIIEFSVTSTTEHYHVPLLLSPFGYSTYRGS
jgi:5-hydroxyisourate hydrolase